MIRLISRDQHDGHRAPVQDCKLITFLFVFFVLDINQTVSLSFKSKGKWETYVEEKTSDNQNLTRTIILFATKLKVKAVD